MAFGFPAYHKVKRSFSFDEEILTKAALKTFEALEWKVTYEEDNFREVKTAGGVMSIGERFKIRIENGLITARSECAIPTQCIDFGKNKRIIEQFFETLDKELSEK